MVGTAPLLAAACILSVARTRHQKVGRSLLTNTILDILVNPNRISSGQIERACQKTVVFFRSIEGINHLTSLMQRITDV